MINVQYKYINLLSLVQMLSVTKKTFHTLYQGSELVVAGRLPPHSSPLTVTSVITALTAHGNTTYLAQVQYNLLHF